jgi:hypothetical protein
MIPNVKASSHEKVKEILAEYRELIVKLKDELDKEKAIVDYYENEENWIARTQIVAEQKVYTMHSIIHMRKAAFKRQMERRKNL